MELIILSNFIILHFFRILGAWFKELLIQIPSVVAGRIWTRCPMMPTDLRPFSVLNLYSNSQFSIFIQIVARSTELAKIWQSFEEGSNTTSANLTTHWCDWKWKIIAYFSNYVKLSFHKFLAVYQQLMGNARNNFAIDKHEYANNFVLL